MFQAYYAGIRGTKPPRIETGSSDSPKKGIIEAESKWIHPMPIYTDNRGREFRPVVSSGFKKKHKAADLMYKRLKPGEKDYPVYDKRHFCPSGIIPFLASQDGYVWYSRYSKKYGWNVRLDHGWIDGTPYNTFSQHMSKLYVPIGIEEGKMPTGRGKRFYVKKGEMLGIVGHSPGDHLNHEHYAIWTATPDKAINPKKILDNAEVLYMDDPRIRKPTGQEIYLVSKPEEMTPVAKTALAFGIPAVLALALIVGEIDEYDLAVYHGEYDAI